MNRCWVMITVREKQSTMGSRETTMLEWMAFVIDGRLWGVEEHYYYHPIPPV
jgi:hypothetical protein